MTVDFGQLPSRLPEVEEAPHMPAGFAAGAVRAGIKDSGRADLGLLVVETDRPAAVAGMFTTNQLAAAPVRLSRRNLEMSGGYARAIVSTSGCANAATGAEGELDQLQLMAATSEYAAAPADQVLAISTGLIGTRLPVQRLRAPLKGLAGQLSAGDEGLAALTEQMCTTDTRVKAATVRLGDVTVTGISKGVGMIHPRMATMLAVLLTDASAEPGELQTILTPIVQRTWNQLTVDGDTSTNDTVFLLASGASAVRLGADFAGAVEAVARSLARQQAADGEGATTLITCQVSGADSDEAARAGRSVGRGEQPGQDRCPRSRPKLGSHRGGGRQRGL